MANALRPVLRSKVVAALTATLLLGSVSAAAPLHRAADADILHYHEHFYSNASYTVKVGSANAYCDGDYIMKSGYATPYSTLVFRSACP